MVKILLVTAMILNFVGTFHPILSFVSLTTATPLLV